MTPTPTPEGGLDVMEIVQSAGAIWALFVSMVAVLYKGGQLMHRRLLAPTTIRNGYIRPPVTGEMANVPDAKFESRVSGDAPRWSHMREQMGAEEFELRLSRRVTVDRVVIGFNGSRYPLEGAIGWGLGTKREWSPGESWDEIQAYEFAVPRKLDRITLNMIRPR
ncbi:MAG: hypothetical protein O2812_06460, partial [Chloroflexi bacterium]|nr:hypothetical protein [Chloroflexota bacterium]